MLDLLALATPLEPVKLPNGRELAARPLDAEGWELLRTIEQSGDDAQALALLQRILPDATDADLSSLGIEDVQTLMLYAARKIRLGFAAVGNSSGAGAGSSSLPSPPPSTPSTS